MTIACRSFTFVGSGSGWREALCCLACLRVRRFKVLHFVEGKYEVFHNFDALLYDKTVALCKRKMPKSEKKLHGFSRNETRATSGVCQINAFQNQRQFRRLDLGLQCIGMLERR